MPVCVPYSSDVQEVSRGFDADADTVPQSRRFARQVLTDWGRVECEWVVLQLLSELVTNAVIHARTSYTVTISDDGEHLRLGVRDSSARVVIPRQYDGTATTGRGLMLVAQMSQRWGVDHDPEGKTVWAQIDPAASEVGVNLDAEQLLSAFDDEPNIPATRPAVIGRVTPAPSDDGRQQGSRDRAA